jgi:hypothetical protein
MYSKSKLILSAFMTMITVLMLLVALPSPANIILHRQQQEALAQTNDNSTFKLYENPFYDIQIQYPSNWTINVYGDIVFLPPARADSEADRPSLIVEIEPTHNWSSYLNLNEYLTSVTKGYDNIYFDVKVIESSTNSTLAGKPAYKLVFTKVGFDKINYKSMELGTIIGNKAYSITYTAEEKQYLDYLPTILKMIDSLKITISNATKVPILPPPPPPPRLPPEEAQQQLPSAGGGAANQTGPAAGETASSSPDVEAMATLNEARQAIQNNNNIDALRALNSLELQLLDLSENQGLPSATGKSPICNGNICPPAQ